MLYVTIILGLLAVIAIFFAYSKSTKMKQLKDELETQYKREQNINRSLNENLRLEQDKFTSLDTKHTQLLQELASQKQKISELAKYQEIIDVKQYVENMKHQAHQETQALKVQVKQHIDHEIQALQAYKQSQIQYAEQWKQQIQQKILELKNFLELHRQKRIQQADDEARKLYQEYYQDYQNIRTLRQQAKALEAKINGYSDIFILPTQTMLDELISEYGHLDASRRLKTIKDDIQSMVKNKTSAECDYVETNRKDTAIEFITNAFNGRADVYVSKLKHDNVGKLIQSLKDDFLLLNHYGKAFRNARISEQYLNLRIEELKWGAMILEFKEQEKEEQRAIREQMKEEEKARKEYEKAIKEAEKEERLLKKAYEQARQEFEKASDDQKAKFDTKMQELMLKLKEAEDKNKRAVSMAQQTKAGHVYVISNIGSFGENVLKLGMTRRLDPLERVKELGDASVPFVFDVHAMIYSEDAPALEKQLHQHFNHTRVNKVNYKKEFFNVQLQDVKNYLDSLGIQAHFTMKAEAIQYRETLQIQSMSADEQKALEQHLTALNENDVEDD